MQEMTEKIRRIFEVHVLQFASNCGYLRMMSESLLSRSFFIFTNITIIGYNHIKRSKKVRLAAKIVREVFDIDVGLVEYHHKDKSGKKVRSQLEIDFVANKGSRRFYIQSILSVSDEAKREKEVNSLNRVEDSYKKVVVVKDDIIPWHDEKGILYIGIRQFLLEEGAMEI